MREEIKKGDTVRMICGYCNSNDIDYTYDGKHLYCKSCGKVFYKTPIIKKAITLTDKFRGVD